MRSSCLLLVLLATPAAYPYSVLAHEAIIDSAWDDSISKLLLKRFPDATPDDLKKAHAFAYGGCILQDMGYYPFGSRLFSDLVHYVRSGDFVLSLIRNSQNLQEYAFSLGALAHYTADNNGHPIAVNRSVPMLYPKLRKKFGDRMTYEDNPAAHLKTEFGFDVIQVAKGHYAPDSYRSFIGFEVSKPVLQRAFRETYGLELDQVFSDLDLAIGTYRKTVGSIIPSMTKVAWHLKKSEIQKDIPGITRKRFLYNLSRAAYRKTWDDKYKKPGVGARILAFLFRILPKVGPFKVFALRMPTAETEKMFMASFNATMTRYRELVGELSADRLQLPNENLDVGAPTGPGQYKLKDRAYASLLDKLQGHYADMSRDLRHDILDFYQDLSAPFATKKDPRAWAKVVAELDELRKQGKE